MFDLFSTLLRGANAKAVETATDHFAIDLINQKIREADQGVDNAKTALAALILRQRHEQKCLEQLSLRTGLLEDRVRQALAANQDSLANDGAAAIADLENEVATRRRTLDSLNERVSRLRLSVEKAHRRVADLRQSAVAAQAMDLERKAQRRVNKALGGNHAISEAEQWIKRVTEQSDPLLEAETIDEIDRSLSHHSVEDRLAEAGFGPATKTRAEDVLARLRNP